MSTVFGTYTNYGYTVYLYHEGQTNEIHRHQMLPSDTIGLWDIGKRCERVGVAMADERGVEWRGCRYDEDEDEKLRRAHHEQRAWLGLAEE